MLLWTVSSILTECEAVILIRLKAQISDFTFVNMSTRTAFPRFPFVSDVPAITILEFAQSSFMWAFLHARFIPFACHSAQYVNYKERWNVNITMCSILSAGKGRHSFLADIAYNGNLCQESKEQLLIPFSEECYDTDPTYLNQWHKRLR